MKSSTLRIFAILLALTSCLFSFAKADTTDPYMDPQLVDKRIASYGIDDVSNVDAFTGLLNIHHTDISLPGVGPAVEVTRNYRSSPKVDGYINVPLIDYRGAFGFAASI